MSLPVLSALCFLLLHATGEEGACPQASCQRADGASVWLAVEVDSAGPGEGLQLLHTAAAQTRPSPHRVKASASLDALGRLADIELSGKELHGDSLRNLALGGKSRGKALEEAALAAAALAVAEEAAAARAVGGGRAAQILATAHHVSKLPSNPASGEVAPLPSSVTNLREDAGPTPGSTPMPAVTAVSPLPSASEPFHAGGINPFNPFRNPFFNPFMPNPYAPFNGSSGGGGGHNKFSAAFIVFIVVVVLVVIAFLCNGYFDDEDDESGLSEEDERIGGVMGALRRREIQNAVVPAKKTRTCACCCFGCCGLCSFKVLLFFLIALLVTFVGGAVLWNTGILQPLLAQLLLMAYIVFLIVSFAMLIVWEATAFFRKGFKDFFGKAHQIDGMFPWLKNQARGDRERSPRY